MADSRVGAGFWAAPAVLDVSQSPGAEAGGLCWCRQARLPSSQNDNYLPTRVRGEYIFICFVLNNNHLFLIVLKFRKSKIKSQWVGCLVRTHFPVHKPSCSCHIVTWRKGQGAVWRPFSKDSNPIHGGSTLMTSFPKGPTSQHHHTGEWVSTYAFWEHIMPIFLAARIAVLLPTCWAINVSPVPVALPFSSALLTTLKPLTVWITTNYGKFFKRWEYQHHNLKASVLWCSAFFMVQPSHLYMNTRKIMSPEKSVSRSRGNRTGHGTADWFQIGKGVCQGCILSSCLFNLYAEYIMWNAGLDESQAGINITGEISIISNMQMIPL